MAAKLRALCVLACAYRVLAQCVPTCDLGYECDNDVLSPLCQSINGSHTDANATSSPYSLAYDTSLDGVQDGATTVTCKSGYCRNDFSPANQGPCPVPNGSYTALLESDASITLAPANSSCNAIKCNNSSLANSNFSGGVTPVQTFGGELTVNCENGYAYDPDDHTKSSFTIECISDASYSTDPANSLCLPVKCGTIPVLNQANTKNAPTTPFDFDTAEFDVECSAGYSYDAGANYQNNGWTVSCGSNNNLVGLETCAPVICSQQSRNNCVAGTGCPIASGDFDDSAVTTTCNTGYTTDKNKLAAGGANGKYTSFCDTNQTWSHAGDCQAVTCASIDIANATVDSSGTISVPQGEFEDGTTHTVTCETGYTMDEQAEDPGVNTTFSLTCPADGVYNPAGHSCKAIICAATSVANSDKSVALSIEGTYANARPIVVTCDQGYTPAGDASHNCCTPGDTGNCATDWPSCAAAKFNAVCETDGTFTVNTCKPVPCVTVPIANSDKSGGLSGNFDVSTLVNCDAGYTGDRTWRCQSDQIWRAIGSDENHTCDSVPCKVNDIIDNCTGDAKVLCDDGFEPNGTDPTDANVGWIDADSEWTGTSCDPVPCDVFKGLGSDGTCSCQPGWSDASITFDAANVVGIAWTGGTQLDPPNAGLPPYGWKGACYPKTCQTLEQELNEPGCCGMEPCGGVEAKVEAVTNSDDENGASVNRWGEYLITQATGQFDQFVRHVQFREESRPGGTSNNPERDHPITVVSQADVGNDFAEVTDISVTENGTRCQLKYKFANGIIGTPQDKTATSVWGRIYECGLCIPGGEDCKQTAADGRRRLTLSNGKTYIVDPAHARYLK